MSDSEPSDLICRSRREPLSTADEQRLFRLLESSEEAQWQADALDQSERESAVQPGDDALIARVASRALKPVASSGRLRIRAHALQVAAAVLLVGAMAGALGWSGVLESVPGLRTSAIKAPEQKLPAPARRATGKPTPRGEPESAVVPVPSSPPVESEAPAAETVARTVAAAPSAAELLARANLARREGRTGEARRVYQSIVGSHARSREAPLAHLALGKLLERSEPALALAHFEALATGGGGLRAEGLWGQAECARRLDRKAAEEQALQALVREFPASSYAAAARGRVQNASP